MLRRSLPTPFSRFVRPFGIAGLVLAIVLGMSSGDLAARSRSIATNSTINAADLPFEARETLALIHRGGPFPFSRDGVIFSNREKRLPLAPRGAYREYTVVTPGSRDRGARRIIARDGRQFWYTADHYRSFKRIIE